jgi:hypothetical protein
MERNGTSAAGLTSVCVMPLVATDEALDRADEGSAKIPRFAKRMNAINNLSRRLGRKSFLRDITF